VPTPFLFAIYVLAIARLTTLAIDDKILEAPRNALRRWLLTRDHGQLWYLTTCPWCLSIWISAATIPVIYAYGQTAWLEIPGMVLAASEITGLIAASTPKGD